MTDRGSALFEILILGFVGALFVLQAITASGRIQAAGEEATEAAQAAAAWAARYGTATDAEAVATRMIPGASVTVAGNGAEIEVVVRQSVSVIGPEAGPIRLSVTGRATAPISPYRSRDG